MNIFTKLKLVFTYGSELEEVLKEKRVANWEAERIARQNNLKLCIKHESWGSIYSENNCDHCKVLKELAKLEPVRYETKVNY